MQEELKFTEEKYCGYPIFFPSLKFIEERKIREPHVFRPYLRPLGQKKTCGYPIFFPSSGLKDIIIPLYKYNKDAKNPEKINRNTYKFFSDFDYELIPERKNFIKTGFFLKDLYAYIIPSDFHKNYDCNPTNEIIYTGEISTNVYCYTKYEKDPYFAVRFKKIEKNTCILYLNIISSSNEENYIFDIINSY